MFHFVGKKQNLHGGNTFSFIYLASKYKKILTKTFTYNCYKIQLFFSDYLRPAVLINFLLPHKSLKHLTRGSKLKYINFQTKENYPHKNKLCLHKFTFDLTLNDQGSERKQENVKS